MKILKITILLVIVLLATMLAISAESEISDFVNYGDVFVIESTICLDNFVFDENGKALITLCKDNDGETLYYGLLLVDEFGNLGYENLSGEFSELTYNNGQRVQVANGTTIGITYDSVLGMARYYVNNRIVYCVANDEAEIVSEIFINGEFFYFNDKIDNVWCDQSLSNLRIYDDNGLGAMEIVALQEHISEKKLRVLAGVDTLLFSAVGFEMRVCENGVFDEITDISSNTVFECVTENNDPIYASRYGYRYFAVLEFFDVDLLGDTSYLSIRPYTVIDGVKHYGSNTVINTNGNKMDFDENLEKSSYDGVNSLTENINCAGEIYAYIFSDKEAEISVSIDGVLSTTSIEQGRNNVLLECVNEGMHTLEIKSDNAKIYSLYYLKGACEHIVDSNAIWSIENGHFTTSCIHCEGEVSFTKADAPEFALDFENSVNNEDSYNGFSIVSPQSFTIGTDVDGDKALVAGGNKFYIDVDSSVLAKMNYYLISFDVVVTKGGNANADISLLTLISNYRDGAKVSGKKADHAYLIKYNVNNKSLSPIDSNGDNNLLNSSNSVAIELGTKHEVSVVIDNQNCVAHIFVDGTYLGVSEKTVVDVLSGEDVYPSFKFNDGGSCAPIFDNFKIFELE